MDDLYKILMTVGSMAVAVWMYFTAKRQDLQDKRIEALVELYKLIRDEVFEDEDDDHTGEDRGSGAGDGTTSPPSA